MQLRREKILCYFCDEKFSFNHKRRNRHYLTLQGEEDDNQEEDTTLTILINIFL